MEKADKTAQTNHFDVFPFDSSPSGGERGLKLYACSFCGSLERKNKRCPFKVSKYGCYTCQDSGHYFKDCISIERSVHIGWLE